MAFPRFAAALLVVLSLSVATVSALPAKKGPAAKAPAKKMMPAHPPPPPPPPAMSVPPQTILSTVDGNDLTIYTSRVSNVWNETVGRGKDLSQFIVTLVNKGSRTLHSIQLIASNLHPATLKNRTSHWNYNVAGTQGTSVLVQVPKFVFPMLPRAGFQFGYIQSGPAVVSQGTVN